MSAHQFLMCAAYNFSHISVPYFERFAKLAMQQRKQRTIHATLCVTSLRSLCFLSHLTENSLRLAVTSRVKLFHNTFPRLTELRIIIVFLHVSHHSNLDQAVHRPDLRGFRHVLALNVDQFMEVLLPTSQHLHDLFAAGRRFGRAYTL